MCSLASVKNIKFGDEEIEVIHFRYNGETFMVANPFARALEYSNCRNAISKFVSKKNQCEYRVIDPSEKSVKSYIPLQTKCINIKGIYELLDKSKMPKARSFRLWLINKLIPQIKDPLADYHDWCIENSELIKELKERHNRGSVYIATTNHLIERHIFKIGMTIDLEKRLHSLNSASPDDYFYVSTYKTIHFIELEKYLHFKFAKQNYKREFFILSEDDLSNLYNICAIFILNINKC